MYNATQSRVETWRQIFEQNIHKYGMVGIQIFWQAKRGSYVVLLLPLLCAYRFPNLTSWWKEANVYLTLKHVLGPNLWFLRTKVYANWNARLDAFAVFVIREDEPPYTSLAMPRVE